MGTRAAFFIGDFRKPEAREWLGCIAWDGYPSGLPEISSAKTESDFRAAVSKYSERHDFACSDGPFPFPWQDDLCLTDCTYTWYEGEVWCEFDRRFVPLSRILILDDGLDDDEYDKIVEKIKKDFPVQDCIGIPAPGKPYDGSAPDSIMIIGMV